MDELKLIKWVAEYCISTVTMKGEWKLAFTIDAGILFDGPDDDKLKWFTPEEMLENYHNNITRTIFY